MLLFPLCEHSLPPKMYHNEHWTEPTVHPHWTNTIQTWLAAEPPLAQQPLPHTHNSNRIPLTFRRRWTNGCATRCWRLEISRHPVDNDSNIRLGQCRCRCHRRPDRHHRSRVRPTDPHFRSCDRITDRHLRPRTRTLSHWFRRRTSALNIMHCTSWLSAKLVLQMRRYYVEIPATHAHTNTHAHTD